jgi:hypothetical protein
MHTSAARSHARSHSHRPAGRSGTAAAPGPPVCKLKIYNPRHPERMRLCQTVDEHAKTRFELASARSLRVLILDTIRRTGYESIPSGQVRGSSAINLPILDTRGLAMPTPTMPYAERIDQNHRKSIPDVTEAPALAARTLSQRVGGVAAERPTEMQQRPNLY